MVMDLLVDVIPGTERDALFSPEAIERRKEGVWKLMNEMTISAPDGTENATHSPDFADDAPTT